MEESDWVPILRFLDLKREIDEAFGTLIDEPWGRTMRAFWMPAVDIDETADAYIVTIDLPGLCEDDVELHVRPTQIAIRGTRVAARTVASAVRVHTERVVGHFHRQITLPRAVDPDTAEIRCDRGIYQIRLKKRSRENE